MHKLKYLLILFVTTIVTVHSQNVSIKLVFETTFSQSFQSGMPWANVNETDVKNYIINRVTEDYQPFNIPVSTTQGSLTAYIGRIGDGFGYAVSGLGSFINGTAYAEVYSNSFASYSEWQGVNATVSRIGEAIAGTTSHEIGHLINLYHAYMFDSFDPTISGALLSTYQPKEPEYLPPACTTDANKHYHLMATRSYITLEQRATLNRFFSLNSTQIINFANSGGYNVSRNITWGINSKTFHQLNNVNIASGKTFIIASGGYTHNLNNYYLYGSNIQKYGTVVPYSHVKLLQNGSLIGLFTSISSALEHAVNGQTVSVLSMNYTVSSNITVQNGVTLEILPGATININPGNYIIVNGTLNAVGTSSSRIIFNRTGTSGQWGGIQFNTGSNGNIQYANISNCSPGISLYSSNYIKIENCTFTDCFNSIFAMGGRTYFYKNTITGSYYSGIRALSGSSLTLAKQTLGEGNNQIKDGRTGSYSGPAIYADGNSYVLAGDEFFGDAGYNSITNYPSFVTSDNAWVDACYNWWGSYPPNSSKFLTYNGGTINYDPALTSAPIISKLSTQTESSTNEKLSKALVQKSKGDFNNALLLLEQLYTENKDNNLTKFIIVQLGDCINSLKGNLSSYAKDKKIDSKYQQLINELVADKKANDGEIGTAIKMYEAIINAKPEAEIEKSSLFKTAILYESFMNDKQTADKYYDELIKKYPEDELSKIIYLKRGQLYDVKNYFVVNDESIQQESFSLDQNSPNPFNPTTKITFTLPAKEVVKLKVYDILGREVVVLANGGFEMGKHEIEFNASRLPSGVYFYNLTTSTNSITKKMLLLK